MPRRIIGTVIGAAALMLTGAAAQAQDCASDVPGYDMNPEQATAVYQCLREAMQAGYAEGDKRWIPAEFVSDYPNWTQVSTFPAAPGFHSGRFLVTFVNDVGVDEYLKYEEGVIPAGTVIAKESFMVDDDGAVSIGPLFIMQKVEPGTSPETLDWYYMMVGANGAPQGIDVMTACNTCHMEVFGEQGGLGFPVEDARLRR